jgi:hypothetical protein
MAHFSIVRLCKKEKGKEEGKKREEKREDYKLK